MSKLPKDQQESLSETYKKPIATHLLTRLLAAFLQKNQPTNTTTTKTDHSINDFTEQTDNEDEEGEYTPVDFWQSKWSNNNNETTSKDRVSQNAIKDQRALLLSTEHNCDCGRLYQVNFKKKTIIAQKENKLYEHIDINMYTFLVHCNRCDSDHEVKINNTENDNDDEAEVTLCSHCDPARKGSINVNTGEITWH
jgi:hypothetical protein